MKKRTIFILITIIVLTSISAIIGYNYTSHQIEKDHEVLLKKIDDLFNGKQIIADGEKVAITGEYDKSKKKYTLLLGGFTIYQISKESDGFVKTIITPGNLTYGKNKYSGDDYDYDYYSYLFRPSAQTCYDNTYKLILYGNDEDNIKDSYTDGKYTELKNFPDGFISTYYSVVSAKHPTEGYETQNSSMVAYNKYWTVNYDLTEKYYDLEKNETDTYNAYVINLFIFCGIGLVFSIIISFIIKRFLPTAGKSESIFNHKWRNISSNSIMTISANFLGKNKVTLIENNKVRKGIAKITDKGTNIQLSFDDVVYFFKLIDLSPNKLELLDLATNTPMYFEILGSNFEQNNGNNLSQQPQQPFIDQHNDNIIS